MPLAWLGGLLKPQGVEGLGGELDAKADLKANRVPKTGALSVDCLSTVSLKSLRGKVPQCDLGNVRLTWGGRVALTDHGMKVAGILKAADLKARLVAQGLDIAQSEMDWHGEVASDGKTPGALKVSGDIHSKGLAVDDLKQASRLLTLDEAAVQSAQVNLGGATDATALDVNAGLRLKGLKADLAAQGMAVEQKELSWQGKLLYTSKPVPDIRLQGDLSTQGSTVEDRKTSTTLVQLGSLAWRQGSLSVLGPTGKAMVSFGGQIDLANLKSRLESQNLDIAQSAFGWQGDIAYDPGNDTIKLKANLSGEELVISDIKKKIRLLDLKQYVIADTGLDIAHLATNPAITLQGETRLTALKARLPEQQLSVRQEEFNWKGRVAYSGGKTGGIEHEGELSVTGLTVEDRGKGLNVLDVDEAKVTDARFKSPSHLEVKTIRFGSTRALERAHHETVVTTHTHTLSLRELTMNRVSFDGKTAVADSIHSTGMICVLVRGADGALEMQQWLPPAAEGTGGSKVTSDSKVATPAGGEKKSPPAEERAPLAYRVGRIELEGDSRLLIRDGAARPPVQFMFRPLAMKITGIDSTKPDSACPFSMSTRVGKYSSINVTGTVSLFAALPTASITSRIESVDLPVFTPYTQQHIGYRLASGTMTLVTDVKLDAGVLKSSNELALHRFDLERLRPNEMDALSTQLGYPVNTALSLLRDGNGDIRLKIPVEGDLRNPQVSIGGVVRKALVNGTANSVRSAVPAHLCSLGRGHLDRRKAGRTGRRAPLQADPFRGGPA